MSKVGDHMFCFCKLNFDIAGCLIHKLSTSAKMMSKVGDVEKTRESHTPLFLTGTIFKEDLEVQMGVSGMKEILVMSMTVLLLSHVKTGKAACDNGATTIGKVDDILYGNFAVLNSFAPQYAGLEAKLEQLVGLLMTFYPLLVTWNGVSPTGPNKKQDVSVQDGDPPTQFTTLKIVTTQTAASITASVLNVLATDVVVVTGLGGPNNNYCCFCQDARGEDCATYTCVYGTGTNYCISCKEQVTVTVNATTFKDLAGKAILEPLKSGDFADTGYQDWVISDYFYEATYYVGSPVYDVWRAIEAMTSIPALPAQPIQQGCYCADTTLLSTSQNCPGTVVVSQLYGNCSTTGGGGGSAKFFNVV